jgi:hypothetical protein
MKNVEAKYNNLKNVGKLLKHIAMLIVNIAKCGLEPDAEQNRAFAGRQHVSRLRSRIEKKRSHPDQKETPTELHGLVVRLDKHLVNMRGRESDEQLPQHFEIMLRTCAQALRILRPLVDRSIREFAAACDAAAKKFAQERKNAEKRKKK